MADKAHVLTDKEIEKMERHLSAIYSRAEKELSEKADKYFERFRKADGKKRELLDAGKITQKEYDTWRKNQLMTGRHWTEMKRQAAHRLTQADQEAADYINGRLPSVYSLNYNAVADGLETRLKGYSFELVDANTVRNLATQDKTLLPYKYIDGAKAERWHTQRVNSEVLQGILQGESIPKIAKRLRDNVGMSARGSAVRNARTAVTSAENKGRMDMLHDAEEKGVKAEKGWLAAHDARVRESHAQVDGEFVGIDDEFSNGLQFPGDPDGRPEEVYNCRCTLIYRVGGVKSNNSATVSFVDSETIDQAEEYARFLGFDGRYNGFNVDVANSINKTAFDIKSIFGAESLSKLDFVAPFPKGFSTRTVGAYVPEEKALWLRRVKGADAIKKMKEAAEKQFEYGYWSTSNPLHIIRHELGHAIQFSSLSESQIKEINDLRNELKMQVFRSKGKIKYKDLLSEYGFTNTREFIAESVAEYLNGNPRETARKVVEIMRGGKK